MDWITAWGTVLTGLVVVFVALGLLILLLTIMGKVLGGTGKKPAPAKAAAPKAAPAAPAPAKKPAPVVTAADDLDGEIAAAITAALAVILAEEGSGKSYVVKSVKRVRSGKGAWGQAGLAENVRPF